MSDFDLREQENKISFSFKMNDIEYSLLMSIWFELLSKYVHHNTVFLGSFGGHCMHSYNIRQDLKCVLVSVVEREV